MTCIAINNDLNLNVKDKCFVQINGKVFGESRVVDEAKQKNLIGVSLPEDAEKYIRMCEEENVSVKYSIIE